MSTSTYLTGPLLKSVSRSFYLTLRVLPRALREPVSLAYLLARATDTIADTKIIPLPRRREALGILRHAIQTGDDPSGLTALAQELLPYQSLPAEKILLEKLNDCIGLLQKQNDFNRTQIARVLETICSGQDLDLQRFGEQGAQIKALKTPEELEDYTYRVAGCVGEFWTLMCLEYLPSCGHWNADVALKRGIHFGKALQLTNILRDLPADLLNGRCYLPEKQLAQNGLLPPDLLKVDAMEKFRPLYAYWLGKTASYYDDAWAYTRQYPLREWRMRLACAWPVLIGVRTVRRLSCPEINPLDPTFRIKVSRSEVWSILIKSTLTLAFPILFDRLYKKA